MDVACCLMIFLLSYFVPRSARFVLTLDMADFQPVRFDYILQPQKRHFVVFHFADSTSMERMCSVASGFTAKSKSCIMPPTPFASDAPNAAAHSSASALLLGMICCFLVYAFKRCRPTSATPALEDFLVSVSNLL